MFFHASNTALTVAAKVSIEKGLRRKIAPGFAPDIETIALAVATRKARLSRRNIF
jgi:hypothetical protein